MSGSCLSFIIMLRSRPQNGDLYLAMPNQCCVQGSLRGCTCASYSWISLPFSPVSDDTCLLPLKSPPLSSLWGEGVFRARALPSPFFDQQIQFLLLFARLGLIQLAQWQRARLESTQLERVGNTMSGTIGGKNNLELRN